MQLQPPPEFRLDLSFKTLSVDKKPLSAWSVAKGKIQVPFNPDFSIKNVYTTNSSLQEVTAGLKAKLKEFRKSMERLEFTNDSYLLRGTHSSKITQLKDCPKISDSHDYNSYLQSNDVEKLSSPLKWDDLTCVTVEIKPKNHKYPWMEEEDLQEALEERGEDYSISIPPDETEAQRIARYKELLLPWHEVITRLTLLINN